MRKNILLNRMYSFLLKSFLFLSLISLSCKGQKPLSTKKDFSNYILLDLPQGKELIISDTKDLFFDKIGILDMELQMGESQKASSRSEVLKSYQSFLTKSVLTFSSEENKLISETLDSCFALIKEFLPELNIPRLKILKISPNHYGPSVYYTRENAILIPSNVLSPLSMDALLPVMLHEISHILLRYNDKIKSKSYRLIGFKKISKPIEYSTPILERLLSNPDGLDNSFAISLISDSEKVLCLPTLVSSQSELSPMIKGFMNYIKFDLYQLEEQADSYTVLSNDEGFSTVSPQFMTSFFEQIKDNTQYIIHPDEIIADNFMMFLISSRDDTLDNYSDSGEKLLRDLANLLNDPNNQN